MMRLLCFFGLHDYERQKWGGRVGHPLWLDCRTCNRCRKFQIWAYDGYKNRDDVILRYAAYLARKLDENPAYLEPLRGADLACWCAPEACHGDLILLALEKGLTGLIEWIDQKELESRG